MLRLLRLYSARFGRRSTPQSAYVQRLGLISERSDSPGRVSWHGGQPHCRPDHECGVPIPLSYTYKPFHFIRIVDSRRGHPGSVLSTLARHRETPRMKTNSTNYRGHRFPPEIISHGVWLYHRFWLSFRDVEELLAKRGIIVSYETSQAVVSEVRTRVRT